MRPLRAEPLEQHALNTTLRNASIVRTARAVVAVLTAAVFWGGNAVGSKVLYHGAGFDAQTLFVARAAWTLPLFVGVALLARPKVPPTRREWALLAALGVAFGPGACGFLALAVQNTSAAHVVLLTGLAPAVAAAISAAALREEVDAVRLLALAIGAAGALLLTVTRADADSSVSGDLLELVQVVAYASTFALTRALGTRFSALFVSGAYGAIAMALLLLYGVATGQAAPALALTLTHDASTLWWFFGEIVIGLSLYAQYAQAYALRILPSATTSIISSYGTLIVGVCGAMLLLHEAIGWGAILSGVMLALALGLALVPVRKKAIIVR